MRDNLILIVLSINIFFTIIWYLYWRRQKQKRESKLGGTIIPLFYPPTVTMGSTKRPLSPSEIHYVVAMQSDTKQFAAEVVNMAVKGLLTIDYKPTWLSTGSYTLIKQRDFEAEDVRLHQIMMRKLFAKGDSLPLAQTHQTTLESVKNSLDAELASGFYKMFLSTPFIILAPVAVGGISLLIGLLINGFYGAAFLSMALIFYVFAGIWGHYITKTYTPEGCVLKNQILGFKLFLAATETDRMDMIGTPPTKTPELYEKYLPYAIALGVEKQWTQQFASVFAQLEKQGVQYHPIWYHGGSFSNFSPTTFTSQISNSMQSASSSSGGGGRGGGSSGGGRGGGGGGSW